MSGGRRIGGIVFDCFEARLSSAEYIMGPGLGLSSVRSMTEAIVEIIAIVVVDILGNATCRREVRVDANPCPRSCDLH